MGKKDIAARATAQIVKDIIRLGIDGFERAGDAKPRGLPIGQPVKRLRPCDFHPFGECDPKLAGGEIALGQIVFPGQQRPPVEIAEKFSGIEKEKITPIAKIDRRPAKKAPGCGQIPAVARPKIGAQTGKVKTCQREQLNRHGRQPGPGSRWQCGG